jgi:mono/diheme cytochrome c family protein
VLKKVVVTGCLAALSVVFVSGQSPTPTTTPPTERAAATAPLAASGTDVSQQRALVDQYCVTCHNQKLKTANLLLDQLDLARLADHPEIAEKVIRKLRAGMMPPNGMPRPEPAALEGLISWMEQEVDARATPHLPPPGIHRLNRSEYANVIRDLLGLEVDATKFLPSDDSTSGFDNIAGALRMSPALMEAYLSAAGKISRLAIGTTKAASQAVYIAPEDVSQDYHIEGLPFGTRGGMLIKHEFPADAYYVFQVFPINKGNMGGSGAFGEVTGEQLKVTVDGELVHWFDWDGELSRGTAVHAGANTNWIYVKAGLHTVGVTFAATNYAPGYDLNAKFKRSTIQTGSLPGMTFYPHVGRVRIEGPYEPEGAEDTPSRRKIFICQPGSPREEESCARQIVTNLAKRAYRRPATAQDVGTLMEFYLAGRTEGGNFDAGIERAVRRLLADPEFIYRRETEPVNLAPGRSYRVSDLALAARLSFFLWSSIPDDELTTLAAQGRLKDPAVLEQQVRRMLADPKSQALVTNFTGQWLNVRALESNDPLVNFYPDFDDNLRQSFRREVELFFDSIVHEDRSILDLVDADYTFVNERLAKHYGIPNVYGPQFRRVTLGPDLDMRRGLLGKGSLLTTTSQAARTSPVTRGKWFLQTFLGISPPDPPPNVPAITEKKDDGAGNLKEPTMRQRMEQHRRNPVCASCHRIFEPIGLTLENFDAVGTYRTLDEGSPIDTSGVLVDGTKVNGVASLREVLHRYSPQYVRVVTEKLMIYALGRGVEYADMPLVRSIVRDAAGNNYRFSSIVMGIVKSAPFQMNTKQPEATQQAAR